MALDSPKSDATTLARSLVADVSTFKVGLWLFTARGPEAVRALRAVGLDVFLDLKLHDIPNTVESAAREAAALGASLLTIHASGGRPMIEAAVRGAAEGSASRGGESTRIVAVTALTSLSAADVAEVGWKGSPAEAVARLVPLARRSGAAGVVCSPAEAADVRREWPVAFIVTPGIRPTGVEVGDQARTATPEGAIAAGASLLVVGRPILDAPDPAVAARSIRMAIASALPA